MSRQGSSDVPGNSPLAELLCPFWASRTMYRESLFFFQRETGEPPWAKLLFPPQEVRAVSRAAGGAAYQEDRDYTLEAASGVLRLTPESRIPFKTPLQMYPPADSALPGYPHKRGDTETHLIFGEGDFFHRLQVEATYTHAAELWQGYVPSFAGKVLPRTTSRLRGGKPLHLWVSGDSISVGGNSSRLSGVPPFMPPYAELVAAGLEKAYGSPVTLERCAGGGWTSGDGLANVALVAEGKPDLVIVAYGMNDFDDEFPDFAANVEDMLDAIRQSNPRVEFVLVAPMLPNPEWHFPRPENFAAFREALAGLCGAGAVLADMTSLWTEMLGHKSYHDLTGNGVNHPNDFGHRLYAQVILGLLTSPERALALG